MTVRLWDEQVAAAYRESFDAFTRDHPDIEVRINVVSYATYFDTLAHRRRRRQRRRHLLVSNAYFAGYADSGRLMDDRQRWTERDVGAVGGRTVHPQR